MPSSITSTYLLPAILLNPAVILHGFNTFMYRTMPNTPIGTSQNPWLERLGPAGTAGHYFDVHHNEQLCWWYIIVMVIVQIFAYGSVADTRDRNRSARASAKAERTEKLRELERRKLERLSLITTNGHVADVDDISNTPTLVNGASRKMTNGHASTPVSMAMVDMFDTNQSIPDTSSEETIH